MPTIQELAPLYEDYLDKGIRACNNDNIAEGKEYLIMAAECLFDIAEKTDDARLRETRLDHAEELIRRIEDLVKSAKRKTVSADGRDNDDALPCPVLAEKPNVHFDDIAGLADVKEKIRRRVLYPFQHPETTERWQKKPGGGFLLYGPPGNGKTLLAKAIAAELDAPFFSVKSSDIMSKWVGDAERNIRKLFDAARAAERLAVVCFDEAEALVGKRGKGSTVMDRVIPEFLAQVDGIGTGDQPILLLGATNRPWDMDEAALRPGRFGDEIIYVPLPDADARRQILHEQLGEIPLANEIELERLVDETDGLTGADLVGLVRRATDLPYSREIASGANETLTLADLRLALKETRPSVSDAMLRRYEQFEHKRE